MSGEPEQHSAAWVALGAVGVVFLLVGVTDLVLAWVPPRIGNAEWEFGTTSAMFNNLPDMVARNGSVSEARNEAALCVAVLTPEPSSIVLLATGLAGLGGLGWHRRRRRV